MTWLLVVVVGSLVVGWIKHRRGVKDRGAGLDPAHPQMVRMLGDEPTGPAHRWSGSRGRP